ncbi:ABC transporter permease [Spongisporangium articulatum]|uniref:ABC transporter permease n=1 Tax=Spongisporangium articulatum TaxID=3362603 RepID=A0ABW8AIB4_9ACTN
MSLVADVLSGAVRGGTSIMYAGLGETVSEKAGVVNLGTEGCMLVGALGGFATAYSTGSPWLGVLVAAIAGGLLAAIHAVLVIGRGANQFASGLTLLFFALGLTSLYGAGYVGKEIHALNPIAIPGLSDIPFLGPILFDQDALTYLSYFTAPALFLLMVKTRPGLLLRTAGERAEVLTVHGYRISTVRYAAVIGGGMLSGIGGAHLSIAYAQSWFENMIVGRGFIAVALVIFASWQPIRVMAGAYLFGAALALSPALQARGVDLPVLNNQFALDVLPFVVTLLVLAFLGKRTLLAAPDELRKVFDNTAS